MASLNESNTVYVRTALQTREGAGVAVTPHGVLPRDSHEIAPHHSGGVHKLMILLRDLLKEQLQKNIFGEGMGGVRGTQTPLLFICSFWPQD